MNFHSPQDPPHTNDPVVNSIVSALFTSTSAYAAGHWHCYWCLSDDPAWCSTFFPSITELIGHIVREHILTQTADGSVMCHWRRYGDDEVCGVMGIGWTEMVRHVVRHHVLRMCEGGEGGCGCLLRI